MNGGELWRLRNGVSAPIANINTTSATANSDPREFTELFDAEERTFPPPMLVKLAGDELVVPGRRPPRAVTVVPS